MSTAIIVGIIIVCILVGYFILNKGDKDKDTDKDTDKVTDKDKDTDKVTAPTYSYDGQNIHNIRSP